MEEEEAPRLPLPTVQHSFIFFLGGGVLILQILEAGYHSDSQSSEILTSQQFQTFSFCDMLIGHLITDQERLAGNQTIRLRRQLPDGYLSVSCDSLGSCSALKQPCPSGRVDEDDNDEVIYLHNHHRTGVHPSSTAVQGAPELFW